MASGLSWFKFRVDAHSHPKLRALSDGEFRLLTYIWTLAQASSVPGLVRLTEAMGVAPADLAAGAGCGRKGKPEAMLARLQELGLILVCDLGIITVHDWEDHNGRPPSWQPTARAAQKRKERGNGVASEVATDVATMSQGMSQDGRNDVRRVDQEEEEEKEEEKNNNDQRGAEAPAQPSIEELQSDWPIELLQRVKLAVTSTRKSGQIAEGPWRAFLLSAKQYSPGLRVRASETYLDGAMAGEGKGERYLLGIMRGERTRLQQPLRNGARGAVLSISEDAKKEHDIPGRKMVSGQ